MNEIPSTQAGGVPPHLVAAVDQWFAQNTGLGGCSDKDVADLAALFWGVHFDGGRESVDDALAVVESFGPGIQGLNDTFARQILLADEVRRLRLIYAAAVKGRAEMRQALIDTRALLPTAPGAAAAAPAITWPKARDVGRLGDMSPDAHIRVGLDSDNDVFVSVWDGQRGGSVEFCNGGGGGGQSMRTRLALIALMVAIEADNAEKPRFDWWAVRNGQQGAKA